MLITTVILSFYDDKSGKGIFASLVTLL